MAWIEPKTDWSPTDYCTVDDINRINGNIAYLKDHSEPTKVYTHSDFITLSEWVTMRLTVVAMAEMTGIEYATPDNRVSYDNFNNIETIIGELKQPIDRRYNMANANKFAGKYYTGYPYTGGRL